VDSVLVLLVLVGLWAHLPWSWFKSSDLMNLSLGPYQGKKKPLCRIWLAHLLLTLSKPCLRKQVNKELTIAYIAAQAYQNELSMKYNCYAKNLC